MKWFKHEGNARNNHKISKLIMKYGIEGYGLYFACVEIIAGELTSENITFELKHDAEVLAHLFGMEQHRVEDIMRYCVDLKLFEISETTKRLVCTSLLKRLDISTSNNPEFKRMKKKIENCKLLDSNSIYHTQIAEENRIEENRIEENRIEENRIYNKRFKKPTVKEVEEYAQSIDYKIDGEEFINYYDKIGWTLKNGNKIKSWEACIRTWKRNSNTYKNSDSVYIMPTDAHKLPYEKRKIVYDNLMKKENLKQYEWDFIASFEDDILRIKQ